DEFPPDLMKAKTVQSRDHKQTSGPHQTTKPARLIVCRVDGKSNRGALLIPDAIRIGCGDMKVILTRGQVAIKRFTAVAGVLPFRVASIEPVPEPDSLRNCEAQGRIADLDVAAAGRQIPGPADCIVLPISMQLLY